MSDPRERSQSIVIFAVIFVACLLLGGTASAAPSTTLSKKIWTAHEQDPRFRSWL
jgi:hypothetical protein